MRGNEVGVDRVGDRVGDPLHERGAIEDDDFGEATLEDAAADAIELVDALGGVAKRVLHKPRDLSALILAHNVAVVAHVDQRENSDSGELPLRLGEPKSEDLISLFCRQKTEFRSMTAKSDVEELAGLSSS